MQQRLMGFFGIELILFQIYNKFMRALI
jgi:hypothetical protein